MGLVVLAGEALFATAVGGCVVWACWLRLKETNAEHPVEARGFSVLPLPEEAPSASAGDKSAAERKMAH
jgi:hypothetical protein